jgi:hypothetical protein
MAGMPARNTLRQLSTYAPVRWPTLHLPSLPPLRLRRRRPPGGALRNAGLIAAACGAHAYVEPLFARVDRGAGLPHLRRIPYFPQARREPALPPHVTHPPALGPICRMAATRAVTLSTCEAGSLGDWILSGRSSTLCPSRLAPAQTPCKSLQRWRGVGWAGMWLVTADTGGLASSCSRGRARRTKRPPLAVTTQAPCPPARHSSLTSVPYSP